jgi:hypothetical protein
LCSGGLIEVSEAVIIIVIFSLVLYIRSGDLLLSFYRRLFFEITKVSEAIIFLILIDDRSCSFLLLCWEIPETIILLLWLCGNMRSKSSSKNVIDSCY